MDIKQTTQIVTSSIGGYEPKTGGSTPFGKGSFSTYLNDALGEANDLQQKADQSIRQLVAGGKGDLQETLVALEKADVSFRLMMQVRNKILEAYQEILRMQV
ncbi:MAG: flagellar hook-basal body complex protein FliE [Deltaproteobacteria bacterium]|nr:flagellar hook-basal body complex protein FliE [Deltaproteobacteria bacterium]